VIAVTPEAVTPEYNRSIPGALRNVIDRARLPHGGNSFTWKPSTIISTSLGVEVTKESTREFLQGYMGKFGKFIERVYTAISRQTRAGRSSPGTCGRRHRGGGGRREERDAFRPLCLHRLMTGHPAGATA